MSRNVGLRWTVWESEKLEIYPNKSCSQLCRALHHDVSPRLLESFASWVNMFLSKDSENTSPSTAQNVGNIGKPFGRFSNLGYKKILTSSRVVQHFPIFIATFGWLSATQKVVMNPHDSQRTPWHPGWRTVGSASIPDKRSQHGAPYGSADLSWWSFIDVWLL